LSYSPLVDGAVRAIDLPIPVAANQPPLGRPLVSAASPQRLSGAVAFPADPRRPFWNPVIAGTALRLWELEPALFPPVAWVALQLPAALTIGVASIDRLLQASRPYRELSTAFAALAARQGMRSWEEAVHGALIYWRDPRGSATLERMVRPLRPAAAGRPANGREIRPRNSAGEGSRPHLRKLEAKLAQAKEEIERVSAAAWPATRGSSPAAAPPPAARGR